ncbi:unnamed protein product [Psylliodes chrysocephalus]|uniref:Serine aminopeptidase S33 domain-containing protein n=1 Tax=Psylliodes chrysocephalus TaxID=3402493 RepID=A0A9P0D768_9CUCU|nr:unnamed protein product [Psylliodes chrysocephala]
MQHVRRNKKSCQKFILGTALYIFVVLLLLFIVIFIILPLVFKYSIGIQRSLVFPTWAIPPGMNYSDIDHFGIEGVKNFYITVNHNENLTSDDDNQNVTLGVWQILPLEILSDVIKNEDYNFDGVLSNGKYDILLYLHGNGHDRSAIVDKYVILRKYFHIFAVDYRGYADSTKAELTETNVVNDITQVYEWLVNRTNSNIFVWGHSLGTAVGTHLTANLKKNYIFPKGLILETPFTSITDVMGKHPFVKSFYAWLPWFRTTIIQPMIDNDFDFDSQKYIVDVDCPIMILHAKDDTIIPYSFATELYNTAVNNRNYTYQGNVTYYLFDEVGYDHMLIHTAPELPGYLENFVDSSIKFSLSKQIERKDAERKL